MLLLFERGGPRAPGAPGAATVGAMSTGKSFHSVSGLWFWKDCERWVFGGVVFVDRGGGGGDLRFAAADVTVGLTVLLCGFCAAEVALTSSLVEGDALRRTTQAVFGRSLK